MSEGRAATRAANRISTRKRAPLRERLRETPIFSGSAFVLGAALLAVWAAWPIYQAPYFFITASGAIALAIGVAWFSLNQAWSWFTTVLVSLAVYVAFGVPLAVPSALGGGADYLRGLLDLLVRTVFGWKELVTIALPVGSYQALLVPFFAVMFGSVVLSLSLVWRAKKLDLLAVPVMMSAILFGIVFGSSLMSPAITIAGLAIPAPRESVIGLVAFLISLGYVANRARRARSATLRRGVDSGLAVRTEGGSVRRLSNIALTAGVLLTAAAVAIPVAAVPLRVDQREVLRTAIEPELQLREFVSPLSAYRSFLSDERFDSELLAVSSAGETPSRLRLAVMSYFDGEVFRVVDPQRGVAERSTAFERMPGSALGGDATTELEVTIADYSEVWMPLAGSLERVDFDGDRKQSLTDGFFYNDLTESGVQLNGLRAGDRYTIRADGASENGTLAGAERPTSERLFDDAVIPESVSKWVKAQQLSSSDGTALQELITRMRARGYLSHALTAAGAEEYKWQAARAGSTFAPSLAGHSSGRIDMLFSALLDKQNLTSSTDNADLVAAVGDDEQFAVAAALVAESLGFPARVVLGFALAPTQESADATAAGASGMPACEAGVCRGRNLSAWVEVQTAAGEWVAVDVTPQFANPLAPSDEQKRDPENTTEVVIEGATEVTPPEAEPAGGGESPEETTEETDDLSWLFAALRIVGVSLLALLLLTSPLIVMSIAKALRRRSRKGIEDATERIVGGWDDYVDTAVDFGLPKPGSRTRRELAERYETPNGNMLAVLADEAVFGAVAPSAEESAAFWASIDQERALLAREFSRWQRLKARLSLRSFTRAISTKARRNG